MQREVRWDTLGSLPPPLKLEHYDIIVVIISTATIVHTNTIIKYSIIINLMYYN